MLYLVPTPIGNLEDITFRSIRVLSEVDVILAEDTRTSSILLKHHQIDTPMRAYHAHNEHRVLDPLIDQLKTGVDIALISDAGTPAISDPGFLLVREAVKNDMQYSKGDVRRLKRNLNRLKRYRKRKANKMTSTIQAQYDALIKDLETKA